MSNPEERTKKIIIQDDNLNLHNIKNAPITFDLGIKTAHSPAQSIAAQNNPGNSSVNTGNGKKKLVFGITPPPFDSSTNPRHLHQNKTVKNTSHWVIKIWNALEFITLTAAIFMIFFLIVNFDSYKTLFIAKLDQLRAEHTQNTSLKTPAENLKNAPQTQKPLPIVQNQTQAQKQFPMINLEVAPPDDRVIIPRINQNVPIVRVPTDKLIQKDWAALESQIQDALRSGVVHYPGTAMPGEGGNVVITGHSSYFVWDPGRFKDVFALLHQVNVGDTIVVYHEQKKYTYKVSDKFIVKPNQVDVLMQNGENKLTLITCTPVGTALNRLIVQAKPI